MKDRCYNPNATAYPWYGAIGVTVCDRWRFGEDGLGGFECFLADVGERPALELTLDRIEGHLGYQPGNVKWSTKREQGKNRRNTNLHSYEGELLTLREIAERTGQSYERIRHRVARAGWSVEEAAKTGHQAGRRRDLEP